MAEPVRIAVVMEGGIVQCILSAGVPVEFVVVDYDADSGQEIVQVPQDGGWTAPATIYRQQAEANGPWCEMAFSLAGEAEAAMRARETL